MAKNYRGEGNIIDFPYIVQTGVTLTAGSLVWVDVSGTNVVHPIRSYSAVSPESNATLPASGTGRGLISLDVTASGGSGMYLGAMANTQTGTARGAGGSQTGVSIICNGELEYLTTPTSSANLRIGYPVYAVRWDTVCGGGILGAPAGDPTGTNATGAAPIGIATFFPAAVHVTNTAVRVRVKLQPIVAFRPGL